MLCLSKAHHVFACVQTAEEALHRVRLAAGSGLRADVWREFVRRFGKIQIRESYGLTEASIGFVNYTDEVGPIGRATFFNKVCYSPQCAISSPSLVFFYFTQAIIIHMQKNLTEHFSDRFSDYKIDFL